MLLFGVGESRKQRAERQPLDIARVDPGKQRFRKVGRGLAAETACHERANGFVGAIAIGRPCEARKSRRPSASSRATKTARFEGTVRSASGCRAPTPRAGVQLPVALNESEPRRQCRDQAIPQAELLAQPDPVRFLNQQGIGSRIDRVAVDLFADDDAARPATPVRGRRTRRRGVPARRRPRGPRCRRRQSRHQCPSASHKQSAIQPTRPIYSSCFRVFVAAPLRVADAVATSSHYRSVF